MISEIVTWIKSNKWKSVLQSNCSEHKFSEFLNCNGQAMCHTYEPSLPSCPRRGLHSSVVRTSNRYSRDKGSTSFGEVRKFIFWVIRFANAPSLLILFRYRLEEQTFLQLWRPVRRPLLRTGSKNYPRFRTLWTILSTLLTRVGEISNVTLKQSCFLLKKPKIMSKSYFQPQEMSIAKEKEISYLPFMAQSGYCRLLFTTSGVSRFCTSYILIYSVIYV